MLPGDHPQNFNLRSFFFHLLVIRFPAWFRTCWCDGHEKKRFTHKTVCWLKDETNFDSEQKGRPQPGKKIQGEPLWEAIVRIRTIVTRWFLGASFKVNYTGCLVFRKRSTLRHGIQKSMEAVLACHPALSTEWLCWVEIRVNCDRFAQAQLMVVALLDSRRFDCPTPPEHPENQLIPKTIGNRKRDCAWGGSGW